MEEITIKKAILISGLSLSIFGVSTGLTSANAEELTIPASETTIIPSIENNITLPSVEKLNEIEVEPRVKWKGDAYITTTGYSNVTESNNVFNDRPLVTNASGNFGAIKVKVTNSEGAQIGSVHTIEKGESARLDSIPWNSGKYVLKAKAVEKNGTYTISIN